ncbi:MAG TPA: hypothetical protein VHC22_22920 [Pirellulales bacterium]|nr:hypothetical protein [Pirellulales bacterium]
MAVGTSGPDVSRGRLSDSDGFGAQVIECNRYIETQLHRTRRQVKSVDLVSSLMLLAVGALAYLMLVALIDHWLIRGGLGFGGRLAAACLLAVGALAFVVLRIVPLIVRRVNPVYAAYTIERHRPGIKNSLINFLLLRSEPGRLPERFYQAMEVQAATALAGTHSEVAVDRTPVIRLLLTMVAITVCVALYAVLSPKNPFTSFRRVISPWADVAPPTRVSIEDIQPGNGQGFHDAHVMVSARIEGLRTGEAATVHYSTVDGQVVDKAVPMTIAPNSYRHSVELPPDNLGLQQDIEYWIAAGDALSPHYRLKVDTAPAIGVEEIEYQYPAYSELPPRKVARHGDIQGLSGTRITLRAKANQLIGQANVDFECDGRNDLDMQIDGTKAQITFPLVWNEKTNRAEHTTYQLRFRNKDGHENPKPIRYSIEVIPDLLPEVELTEPDLDPTKELVVPAGKPVRFGVEATDPDFKLTSVTFHARRRGAALAQESLLAEPRSGEFHRDFVLDLKRLSVQPGEQIEFWAAADDNRQPKANHNETPHYHLRVGELDRKDQSRDEQAGGNPEEKPGGKNDKSGKKQARGQRNENDEQGNQGEDGEQPQEKQGGGKSNKGDKQNQQKKEPGEGSDDEDSSSGEQGGKGSNPSNSKNKNGSSDGSAEEKPGDDKSESSEGGGQSKQGGQRGAGDKTQDSKRVDPERDPGKAIDEINKHFNEKEQKGDQSKEDRPQKGDQAAGQKANDQGGKNESGSKEQQGEKSQAGTKGEQSQEKEKGDSKQKEPSSRDDGMKGEKDGDQKNAGQKGSDQKNGEQQGGDQKGGEQKGGEQNAGKGSDQKGEGKKQTSDKKSPGSKQPKEGDKQGAPADKDHDQKPGDGERGGGQDGDKPQGDEPKGAKQTGNTGKQASDGEKGAEGSEKGTPNEGGDKTEKDKTGGGKEGDAKVGDEGAKHADGETKPRQGQGGQAKGAGEPDDKMKKHEGESPEMKGGDQDSKDKGAGGAGDSEGANKHGAPTTHGGNQDRKKKELSPDPKKGTSEDEPESSSEDKRQSDSQGAEQGEHDGGGKSGGGQRSNSEGTGSAGQNSEADQGGSQGEEKGKGPTGSKGGDQQKGDKPSGGKSSGEKGAGTNQGEGSESDTGPKSDSPDGADPRGHNNVSRQPDQPKGAEKREPTDKPPAGKKNKEKRPQDAGAPQPGAPQEGAQGAPTPSDRGGHDLHGGKQRTNPNEGGQPGPDEETAPLAETDNSEPGGDEANQEYARKATDLALERLKDQLAKDKPDPELLEKLKWTREDVERFVQQWERLKKGADEAGPKGDAARQELDDALRSLGLRPRGTSLSGEHKPDDRQRNLRDSRRAPPPPEYQEQWIEFNKATAKSRQRQ